MTMPKDEHDAALANSLATLPVTFQPDTPGKDGLVDKEYFSIQRSQVIDNRSRFNQILQVKMAW